jgi:hypothetical protein
MVSDGGQLDLEAITAKWLQTCGSCDAGAWDSPCTHPADDYRSPMAALVAEVERLRRENADLRARHELEINDWAAWTRDEATGRDQLRAERGAWRDVIEAAKAWRASRVGSWRSADHTLAAAVDALSQCCDLHGRNCEPPSELCCQLCTEASHPEHRDGTTCSAPDLSRSQLAAEEPADA